MGVGSIATWGNGSKIGESMITVGSGIGSGSTVGREAGSITGISSTTGSGVGAGAIAGSGVGSITGGNSISGIASTATSLQETLITTSVLHGISIIC
jgi:hypothetical protein